MSSKSISAFKSLFPLGNLMKKDVRKLASEIGLNTNKKIHKGCVLLEKLNFNIFTAILKPKIGNIIEINSKHDIFKKRYQLYL